MIEIIQNIDNYVFGIVNENVKNPLLDVIMPIITRLGDKGVIWIIISVILILNKKYRMIGILSIVSLFVTVVLGEGILKIIFERPRPFSEISDIELLINRPTSSSFPSGHTASSFAMFGVHITMVKDKKNVIFVFILASLIAFSRLYLGVHYFTDICGGIILGLLSSMVVCKLYLKCKKLN